MKTIVTATDFSDSSVHAVNYAADLALFTGTSLTILHVYTLPVGVAESLPVATAEELYADAERQMKKLKHNLKERTGGRLEIITDIRGDGVLQEIYSYCLSVNPWMVVMGTEKAGPFLRFLRGGRTLDAVKKLDWPVIIVPEDAVFAGIHRIAFTSDLKDVRETVPVKQLEELVKTFKAELYVLHVSTLPGERFTREATAETEHLRNALKHLHPHYKFISATNVEDAIDDFAQRHKIDLLFTVPKKHGLLHRMFYSSQSKKLVLTSHIPLMSLHE